MPAEAASASASTGIYSPGGSVNINKPSIVFWVVIAVVVIVWLYRKYKKD